MWESSDISESELETDHGDPAGYGGPVCGAAEIPDFDCEVCASAHKTAALEVQAPNLHNSLQGLSY